MNNRRENFKETSGTEKVHYTMPMGIAIRVTGSMTKKWVKAFLPVPMVIGTRREIHNKLVKICRIIQYRVNNSDDNW
jgi:hypothetical protein